MTLIDVAPVQHSAAYSDALLPILVDMLRGSRRILGYFKEIIIQKESGAEDGSGQSIFPSQGDVRSAVQGKPWL